MTVNSDKYFYLCTPYTKWPYGLDLAEKMAAEWSDKFIACGIPIFCPIVHGHNIKKISQIKENPKIWLELDRPFVENSSGLIIIQEEGWHISEGIKQELNWISRIKPVHYVVPVNPEPTILQILSDFPISINPKTILGKRRRIAFHILTNYKLGIANKESAWALIYKGLFNNE